MQYVKQLKQYTMKKIINLKAKVEGIINTSEYRGVKVLGVTCSRSDLEMIIFYLDTYLRQGNINGLMEPRGEVKEVLQKAEINLED